VTPPTKPLLVYDGDCSFCSRWVARWRCGGAEEVDAEPFQTAAERFPEIPRENFGRAVHLIEPTGQVYRGATAAFAALAHSGRSSALFWLDRHVPPFRWIAAGIYRIVANNRDAFDQLEWFFSGWRREPPSYVLSRNLFLRGLGLTYLIAFWSLWGQIDGLVGSQGILPVSTLLTEIAKQFGTQRYFIWPTLCWLNSSDAFLHILCGGGMILACLLIAGIFQGPVLVLLWAAYLSLSVAGQDFLSFQWDCLILEAGFISIFFVPWRFWPRMGSQRAPPTIPRLLLKWLLFRVMFWSGILKLTSGDVCWRACTAMQFHYWTQPIPTWTSWYMAQLPGRFQHFSVAVVFFAEVCLPPLYFAPRRLRLFAMFGTVAFQLLIAATGNYGFFNLLTIVLCILLADDSFWPRRWGSALSQLRWRTAKGWRLWPATITLPLAIVIFVITIKQGIDAVGYQVNWPDPLQSLEESIDPFRTINSYGLFRVMTTQRNEIIIEGSDDGETWKEYQFKYKPGDVNRAPVFTTPHMPRLDWQMWFAALGDAQSNPWFENFMIRLLEGSPPVTKLLAYSPFPDHPPRYVRAVLYDYHFTNFQQRRATGAWWKRSEVGLYFPVVSLRPQ
jgi:predicted DCC family thiol-disulfide oxidoreductase YuxK